MVEKKYIIQPMVDEEVLVTGGMGFLGSNLVHHLVKLKAKVTILDAFLESGGANPANVKGIEEDVKIVRGDLRDYELMSKLVRDKRYIFNFAARASHILSMTDPFTDIDINCRGNMNLLEACRRLNDRAKILFSGTRTQIGEPVYTPIDEKHPDNPSDIYGVNKLAAEKYHLLYNRVYGVETASLRMTNTYGSRHQMKHGEYGIVNWFLRKAMQGETIEVYGDGQQTRDYNYVDDVVDAFLLAAQSKKSVGEVFLLGSGTETRFIDMVNLIIKVVGKGQVTYKPFPSEKKKIDVRRYIVSYDKISKTLGWHPLTSLEEGLQKTYDFYKEHLSEYI